MVNASKKKRKSHPQYTTVTTVWNPFMARDGLDLKQGAAGHKQDAKAKLKSANTCKLQFG